MSEELKNIPADLKITDVFLHLEPIEVARNPELRRQLIEHHRAERMLFMEEGKRAKKVASKKTKEHNLDAPING